MDTAPLFETAQMEAARRSRHKQAYDVYKSFSFLKAGLRESVLEKKLAAKEKADTKKDSRPGGGRYEFPALEETTALLIGTGRRAELLDEGERVRRPGRNPTRRGATEIPALTG